MSNFQFSIVNFQFLIFAFLLLLPQISTADDVTHQLGNSAYLVRWAMQEGADEKSNDHYRKAVELQRKAELKFKHRFVTEALELSREAEKEAKIALKESLGYKCIQYETALKCYPQDNINFVGTGTQK